jgi:hypothetical protein
MPELLLTSEKLQDTTINKIGRDGPILSTMAWFRQACSSTIEM